MSDKTDVEPPWYSPLIYVATRTTRGIASSDSYVNVNHEAQRLAQEVCDLRKANKKLEIELERVRDGIRMILANRTCKS